jgi:hypothetical protein
MYDKSMGCHMKVVIQVHMYTNVYLSMYTYTFIHVGMFDVVLYIHVYSDI